MTLQSNTLSSRLAEELCREIRRQRLSPGAPLGTEADLAVRFGVSRTVVREAIGNLRGLGVVTSRQGIGLSVGVGDPIDTLAKAFVPMAAGKENLAELGHLRFVLEIGSVPLAVVRATSLQIDRMRALAEQMLGLVQQRSVNPLQLELELNRDEIEFHQLVFDAAGGRLASEFHRVLVEYFNDAFGHGPHNLPPVIQGMEEHLDLVAAFATRDAGRAIRTLTQHLLPIVE